MSCDGIYTLRAGGETLTAWSLAELAELLDCALDAGDSVGPLRAVEPRGGRPLTRFEFVRLVGMLAETSAEPAGRRMGEGGHWHDPARAAGGAGRRGTVAPAVGPASPALRAGYAGPCRGGTP